MIFFFFFPHLTLPSVIKRNSNAKNMSLLNSVNIYNTYTTAFQLRNYIHSFTGLYVVQSPNRMSLAQRGW